MMHTPKISPIGSDDFNQTNADSRQSRWNTLGGLEPEPGTLDMSDHQMAVLERQQNIANEVIDLDYEKLDPDVESITSLDCPRITRSECCSLNSSGYIEVEALGDLTIERNNDCLSLFDATKHDWKRFNAVADETGIAVRDDWQLDDLAMALARGDANKTVGDRIRDSFRDSFQWARWALGLGF